MRTLAGIEPKITVVASLFVEEHVEVEPYGKRLVKP